MPLTVEGHPGGSASVATRSTAPSGPQGPKTRHVRPHNVDGCIAGLVFIYGDDHKTAFTIACNIPAAVPTGIPNYERFLALAQAACGGYLGPVDGAVNGSHFYLNKPTKYCFKVAFVG